MIFGSYCKGNLRQTFQQFEEGEYKETSGRQATA